MHAGFRDLENKLRDEGSSLDQEARQAAAPIGIPAYPLPPVAGRLQAP